MHIKDSRRKRLELSPFTRLSMDQPPHRARACPNVSETEKGGGGGKLGEKHPLFKMFLDTGRRTQAHVLSLRRVHAPETRCC